MRIVDFGKQKEVTVKPIGISILIVLVGITISTSTLAEDRLAFGVSAGTPVYLGGDVTAGDLGPRNGELPAGYELGLDVSYCVLVHESWCIGPVAGVHYAYLRGELVSGDELTQGSLQKYGVRFGVRTEYRPSQPFAVLFDAIIGPTYIDPHDLASNGHGWVPEAALELSVLYDNPEWPVEIGPYLKVSHMYGIDAPGDNGGKGLRGNVTEVTAGLRIQF